MKEMYQQLDFDLVKQRVSAHSATVMGKERIIEEQPNFNVLLLQRNLQRCKQALKLYEVYESPSFYGIRDISKSLQHVSKGAVLSIKDIYEIAQFCIGVEDVFTYMKKVEIEVSHIQDLCDALHCYNKIIEEVDKAIDASLEVKDSASSELKDIRRQIKNCESNISKNTQNLVSRYASLLQENITVYRNGRCCLLVKVSEKNKVKGFIHGESASGQAVYIEPEVLVNLNNQLMQLKHKEEEEIYRILKYLCGLIKQRVSEFLSDFETMIVLDVVFTKAKWAFKNQGVYADINHNRYFMLKHARHPLIAEQEVVSNTYEIKLPYQNLLISGSNTGGKTVTLKTIGLFSILTYAAFPILCEEASIPYFDNVFVDVGDAQSIVHSLSTFSAHLTKLAYICNHASKDSLVLLDELGSGTDPSEGEALAIATLSYLREHNIMFIATTHYSKLKEYAKKQDDILLASVGFDMEKMKPTYKYLEGYSGVSNALEIARRYQLQESIIQNAAMLKEEHKSDAQRLLEKLDADRLHIQQREEALLKQEEVIQQLQEKLQKQQDSLWKQKEKMLDEAKQNAEEIRQEAKQQANRIIADLKALNGQVKQHEITQITSQFTQSDEVEEESVEEFAVHDYVSLKKLGYHGEIIALKGNRATVIANGVKMNVKCNELCKTSRPKQKVQASHSSKTNSTARVSMECNIIGMRVVEAIAQLDKYLDSAIYAKYGSVRIVHGMGTGTLRKAVHEYLKKNKYVDTYRMGQEGEGGLGATVVVMKKGKKNG